VRRVDVETSRGGFAALEAMPGAGVCDRLPALLVPGFTGSKEDFIAILQTLCSAGRRVIAIDMRGQYETPGTDDPHAYECAALGADVAAICDSLGGRVHLLGHSFGGLVARETVLAAELPPTSFTLMSSGPAAITGARHAEGRELLAALGTDGENGPVTVATLWEAVLEPQAVAGGVSAEIVAFLRRRMLANSVAGLLQMGHEVLSCPDRVDELAKVELPKLVLYGEDDDGWEPGAQAEMAAKIGAAKVVIPGAAHSPAVDAPETTASALTGFWNAAERGAGSGSS
jgi:pimeloyl-ACP methyl ester carboxylesterase